METIEEFKVRIKKAKGVGRKQYKITGSWGVHDYYKYYRKIRPKEKEYVLTDSQYYAIIRKTNELIAKDIAWCKEIKLPCGMGTIEVRKKPKRISIDETGKVKTNLAIDWNSTLNLWYEDEEARKNKTLLKIDTTDLYKIYYTAAHNALINKSFFEFIFNRDIKRRLKYNIRTGIVDALTFNKF